MFAVIAENDESQWDDETGVLYHFPRRYAPILVPGAEVIYYKGRMTNASFSASRLSTAPHYFGVASIGKVSRDSRSSKGDLLATIEDYRRFSKAVPAKSGPGTYFEQIPPSRQSNYWRDGVRAIDNVVFEAVLNAAGLGRDEGGRDLSPSLVSNGDFESAQEGNPTLRYVTTYERHPRYRREALAIHGYRCAACKVDMGEKYGPYAEGLIHVHHIQPVSTFEAPRRIDPKSDLVPLCPNCHSVIHRNKNKTLAVAELRSMLASAGEPAA